MWNDPIVEEIRQFREDYAAKFNYDVVEICRDLKRQGEAKGYNYVPLPPKPFKTQSKTEGKSQQRAQGVGQRR